jgi:hypothetical protein
LNIQFPFISLFPFLSNFSYRAAAITPTIPAIPPNPIINAFAPPVELTGGGVVDVFESAVEFDLVVVATTLDVVAVTVDLPVETTPVLEGKLELELPIGVLDFVGPEVVVVAGAVAMDAEYEEQRASPTDWATTRSDALQAAMRQPAA